MKDFFNAYTTQIQEALESVDLLELQDVYQLLKEAGVCGHQVFTCGNGACASLADHFAADHTKGVAMDSELIPSVISLASNFSIISAVANDISYDEIFAKQLDWHAIATFSKLIVFSASGSSRNVERALEEAMFMNMRTAAFVGFDGGRIMRNSIADTVVHVKSNNYGVCEDVFQILMHVLAQKLRVENGGGVKL